MLPLSGRIIVAEMMSTTNGFVEPANMLAALVGDFRYEPDQKLNPCT